MKKFTKEKGITLIALVITIIVMLILVAVTISVAINGGLFSKADDAARRTQIEADREELQAAVLDTIHKDDPKPHLNEILSKLDEDDTDGEYWTQSDSTFTKHHKNGDENAFTVTIDENGGFSVAYFFSNESSSPISETNTTPEEEIPEELYSYLFPDGKGRSVSEIFSNANWFDTDYVLDTEEILEDTLYYLADDTGEINGNYIDIHYIKYKDTIYKYATFEDEEEDFDTMTNNEYGIHNSDNVDVSTSTHTPGIGSKINYDGRNWIVMYVVGNEIQMVSENLLFYDEENSSDFYLGLYDSYYTDNGWPNEITEDIDKAMYSYNNAISTLNKVCKSLVDTSPNYVTKVRCIGSNINDDANAQNPIENTTLFTFSNLDFDDTLGSKVNNACKSTDQNYLMDFERLIALDALNAEHDVPTYEESYWLASRDTSTYIYYNYNVFDCCLCTYYNSFRAPTYYALFKLRGYASDYEFEQFSKSALRPVVGIDTTLCNFNFSNGVFTISEK